MARFLQVKTIKSGRKPNWPQDRVDYDALAVVHLRTQGEDLLLDQSPIYLFPKEVANDRYKWRDRQLYEMSRQIDRLFPSS